MRTKNSFFNFLASEGSHFLNMILSFVARTVFIYVLETQYLGVNGLFSNILTVLSLSELGIGGAIIFHMYKPIAEGNIKRQQELMNLYRRMYTFVGIFIFVVGCILVPFLPQLIKEDASAGIEHLVLIYMIYLVNTASSYFFSYKRSIIFAHQKNYIGTIIDTIFTTIQFVAQILVLLVFKNFIIYLLVQFACNILTNVTVAYKADKMYPFLKEDKKSLPSVSERKSIYKNIGAMFLHKLGDVVVNNTDNLIMSAFVGIIATGIYSNYSMLQASVCTALNGLFGAFTASIGDLNATEDKERLFDIYKILYFLGFWMYGYTAVTFLVMYNPFITLWTQRTDLVFPIEVVLIICVNLYIAGIRKVTINFRDAMGLYWYDRYKPIFESIINLVVSLILVRYMGVMGIFVGTFISTMTTCFWVEPLVTYKYGFKKPVSHYFKWFIIYAGTTILLGLATYNISNLISGDNLFGILLKFIVCTVFYNVVIFILFGRTKEFKELLNTVKRIWNNVIRKGKE
ncbi:MAG: lipopolysaccharide biosynthesis protein [Lachnospiraceae bacterium]|nr:lipopolysaccharide biosynthesis protein [Lachnospiraceae bacterium]